MKKTKLVLAIIGTILLILLNGVKLYHEVVPKAPAPASQTEHLVEGKQTVSYGLSFTREVRKEPK